jgi:hypothetical protein
MGQMIIERPELGKVITDIKADHWSTDVAFAFYVLYICSHAYDMHERKVLNDNEWVGKYARRMQIQRLTKEIDDEIMRMGVKGVRVVAEAKHMCIKMRC